MDITLQISELTVYYTPEWLHDEVGWGFFLVLYKYKLTTVNAENIAHWNVNLECEK